MTTSGDRDKLAAELASTRREAGVIQTCVWIVVGGVMIYGLVNVTGMLIDHKVPAEVAWMLSLLVETGLVLALVGTRALARHGVRAGWVGSLRWITAVMTWLLNIATPLTAGGGPDWIGVGIHSAGPVLLFWVVEAAASYQHKIGAVIADLQRKVDDVDAQRRSDRAERADMAERLRRLQTDLDAAERAAKEAAEHAATLEAEQESERAAADRAVTSAEQEAMALRSRLAEQAERLAAEQASTVARIQAEWAARTDRIAAEHARQVAELQAEQAAKIAALRDKAASAAARSGGRSGSKTKAADDGETRSGAPKLTDDEAVAAMLRAHPEPGYEWKSREVHRITGAGFGRIPKLIAIVAEHHARQTQTAGGEPADDSQEDARELVDVGA
ncbi:hypothetical protein [Phytohabitans houttuyneae]|uniref:DUF2637 domain-containing protein n=1 Tax=Phytohabitans houttuyneae TaxID=1076126 RepID=A0A6V8K2S3_9ACTN|nr:hypothetical protein [Phytohabitans houttuyneae]GFJ79442.1 hypothetical protein Phou_036220 [Phytohabitans houttuyneae]